MQTGMKALFQTPFKKTLMDEAFRKRLVRAKTNFLFLDWSTQGMFLTSIGWIKNTFSKFFLTGQDKFSGELGLVSQNTLENIYKKERDQQSSLNRFKALFAASLGAIVPVSLTLLLRKSLITPQGQRGLWGWLRNKAGAFDYNYIRNVPIVSLVPFAIVGFLNDIGDAINSRSPREAWENAIKMSVSFVFLFGDLIWMKVLSGLLGSHNPVPLHSRTSVKRTAEWLQEAVKTGRIKGGKALVQSLTSKAASLYLLSFALNTVAVAGIICLMNRSTRSKIKVAAQKVEDG
jgi:hypothetical protein